MKAIIIEDETAAVNSLKAVLQQNSVTEIEVIAELESIFIWRTDWLLKFLSKWKLLLL